MKTDRKAGEYLFHYHIQPSSIRGNVCKAHSKETTPANSRAHLGHGTELNPHPVNNKTSFFSLKAKMITKLPVTSTMYLIPLVIGSGAATPFATPAATSSATTVLRCTALPFAWWRRPDKSVVDIDSLLEQFGAVQRFNGFFGFGDGRVFDQGVPLLV